MVDGRDLRPGRRRCVPRGRVPGDDVTTATAVAALAERVPRSLPRDDAGGHVGAALPWTPSRPFARLRARLDGRGEMDGAGSQLDLDAVRRAPAVAGRLRNHCDGYSLPRAGADGERVRPRHRLGAATHAAGGADR